MFPLLTNFVVASQPTIEYNCLAWAMRDTNHFWDPHMDYYWPNEESRGYTVNALIETLTLLGFELCEDGVLIDDFEKLAIYSNSSGLWTHVARQLPDGRWASKLGRLDDIEHETLHETLEEVTGAPGSDYGTVAAFMIKRI
jgi:hypothetical protein